MIAEASRTILGLYGVLILDFYLEHQTPINLAVVAYGVVLILRRRRRKNSQQGKSDAATEDNDTQ